MSDFYTRFKKLDNFRLGIIFGIGIALILFSILLGITCGNFLPSDWLFLFFVPAFIGRIASGSTYIARTLDGLQTTDADENEIKTNPAHAPHVCTLFNYDKSLTNINAATADRPAIKIERIGIYSGVLIAFAVTIATFILHDTVPLASSMGFFAYPLLGLGNVGVFAGLGHRVGSIFSTNRTKLEKGALVAGLSIGLTMGIVVAAENAVAGIFVLGISTFLVGGFGTPIIAGIIFTLMMAGIWLSFGDYVIKAVMFAFYYDSNKKSLNENKSKVARNWFEFLFTLVGATIGLGISLILIGTLAINPISLTALMVVITIVSVVGALFSRIGRLTQKWIDVGKPPEAKEMTTSVPPNSSPAKIMSSINTDNDPQHEKSMDTTNTNNKIAINSASMTPQSSSTSMITPSLEIDTNTLSQPSSCCCMQ